VREIELTEVLAGGEQQGGYEQGDGRADFGYSRHWSSVV
jgi:hypothetical protein